MTKFELAQYYYLKRERENADKLKKELEKRQFFAKSEEDRDFFQEQIDKQSRKSKRCKAMYDEIEMYIENVKDSLTRQILCQRYIYGKTWAAVAMAVGGGNTPDSVRKIAERFVDK